jgi:hypothetical protein
MPPLCSRLVKKFITVPLSCAGSSKRLWENGKGKKAQAKSFIFTSLLCSEFMRYRESYSFGAFEENSEMICPQ